MPRKSFVLSIILLSLPIGIITYQLSLQDGDNQAESIETNVPANEASIVKNDKQPIDSSRKITVRNNINKKMITYHKGFFSLTPNFDLSINNQTIKQGQELEVPVIDGKINVTYAYDFMGHKKGKKNIVFEAPPGNDALDITFSWKQEPRIIMGNAKAVEVKEIY